MSVPYAIYTLTKTDCELGHTVGITPAQDRFINFVHSLHITLTRTLQICKKERKKKRKKKKKIIFF